VLVALACASNGLCADIHDAASSGDLEKVKKLITANPELVNSKDSSGLTPLHYTAYRNDDIVCEFKWKSVTGGSDGKLVAADGVVSRLSVGKTAIELETNVVGVEDGFAIIYTKRLGKLKSRVDSLGQGKLDLTPAQVAEIAKLGDAGTGRKEVCEFLLANKADIDAKESNGRTPLHFAAAFGLNDVLEVLLKNKANVNAKDDSGFTPLHLAAYVGQLDAASLLLKGGAEVNAKNEAGETPLHLAVSRGHDDVAELLRKHGGQ